MLVETKLSQLKQIFRLKSIGHPKLKSIYEILGF